jgi:hypothetical protein
MFGIKQTRTKTQTFLRLVGIRSADISFAPSLPSLPFSSLSLSLSLSLYIYIYMYVCMYVCMYVYHPQRALLGLPVRVAAAAVAAAAAAAADAAVAAGPEREGEAPDLEDAAGRDTRPPSLPILSLSPSLSLCIDR